MPKISRESRWGEMILAIDPGCTESAYVVLEDGLYPAQFGKEENEKILERIKWFNKLLGENFAIEMVASYGMAVGVEVFETVFWIGRFWESADKLIRRKIYRKDEKINLCHTMKAKDTNIRQALIDRFGIVGTKKAPGWFYGFKADIWSAYAVGVTYYDMYIKDGAE
jgi:hypothetical protein